MSKEQPRIVLLMDTNRAYERSLLGGILKYSRLHGPISFWRKQNVLAGRDKEISLDMIKAWNPAGIIWREGYGHVDVKSLDLPIIYAPFSQPDSELINIVTDDHAIGQKAADHLLGRGFNNFAFYGLGDKRYFSKARKAGFLNAIKKAGYDVDAVDRQDGVDLSEWLSSLKLPVGLMVSNDDCTVECYDAARKAGLSIPNDVAVIGVGNDEMVCDFASPSLSSVAFNSEYAGYTAARLLTQMIAGKPRKKDIEVSVLEVVERQSTSIFALEDKLISKAIQYIHTHIGENLHVNDVVQATPLSRRSLYQRFKQALGKTIYEEIRQVKTDYAARMLIETNIPISEIAENLGFIDAKNLSRTFYKAKGVTPFKYRTQHSPYK